MTSEFSKAIQDLINHEIQKIEISFVAEIVTFNKATMRAEIKPLLRARTEEDGKDNPKFIDVTNIDDVPVEFLFAGGFFIRPDYKSGDIVRCVCAASSLDQPINNSQRSDMLENRFQLNYCTVTGAVVPEVFTPPASWAAKDGLLIGKGDAVFMQVTDTGFEIEGDFAVSGSLEVDSLNVVDDLIIFDGDLNIIQGDLNVLVGDITAVLGDVKAGAISLKTHTHLTFSPVGTPTGPPT